MSSGICSPRSADEECGVPGGSQAGSPSCNGAPRAHFIPSCLTRAKDGQFPRNKNMPVRNVTMVNSVSNFYKHGEISHSSVCRQSADCNFLSKKKIKTFTILVKWSALISTQPQLRHRQSHTHPPTPNIHFQTHGPTQPFSSSQAMQKCASHGMNNSVETELSQSSHDSQETAPGRLSITGKFPTMTQQLRERELVASWMRG